VQTPHPQVTSQNSILHVEDDEEIGARPGCSSVRIGVVDFAPMVMDASKLTGNQPLEYLIVDNDLPGLQR